MKKVRNICFLRAAPRVDFIINF